MKKFDPFGIIVLFLLLIIALVATFDSPSPRVHTVQPSVIVDVLDPQLEQFRNMWEAEVARRFSNAAVILVHGGDFERGRWIVEGPYASGNHVRLAADLVREYQAQYPDRTIVLLACNPGHLKLGIPGVYYATSSVWCVPDRFTQEPDLNDYDLSRRLSSRWDDDPDVAGNIWEFVAE